MIIECFQMQYLKLSEAITKCLVTKCMMFMGNLLLLHYKAVFYFFLYSGGTLFTAIGSNMDSVSKPVMEVSAVSPRGRNQYFQVLFMFYK